MKNLILPDMMLVLLCFVVLGADLWQYTRKKNGSFHLSWLGLGVIFVILAAQDYYQARLYFGSYKVTGISMLFKQLFVLSALGAILLSRSYFLEGRLERAPMRYPGEFFAIILFCTTGMFAVVSATDLLTLFIGMELATIPLYVLSAFHKTDSRSAEASTKYIIMGGLSTGVMLFGYSFLYGFCGQLGFDALHAAATAAPGDPLLNLGVLLVLAAVGFKLTIFPFHMWAPDVYEGAPTPVTAFLSVSSKATAIAFLMTLLYGPLRPLHSELVHIILALAALTMTIGNLGALRQQNLRRFMAYSSIAQAGYLLMAMAGEGAMAMAAIIYYLMVYAVANYATFFIISIISRKQKEELVSLRGLGKESPILAAALMLAMFSLGGIPPLAGFIGKFLLFAVAAQKGYYWIVVFAALNSTISLYYYLLLVKEAYIVAPSGEATGFVSTGLQRCSLATLSAAMLLLGVMPAFSSAIKQIVGYYWV